MSKKSLAFVLLLAACGGDESIPLDQIDDRLGQTVCAKMVECCTTEELMEELLGASTQAECEQLYTGLLGALLIPPLQDSVANNRLRYDGEKMASCLDSYAGLECPELHAALRGGIAGQCGDPFTGLVADGGMCATDADCATGFCNGDSINTQDGTITYGVCVAYPTLGQACIADTCAPDLRCDRGTGMCAATLADGEACNFDDDCTSRECLTNNFCGASMTCDGL